MANDSYTPEAPIRVLLIEDNPEDVTRVEEILSGASGGSFNIEWEKSLRPGLTRLEAGGIDIVLLDLSLPDSQSIEGVAAVRAGAPHVPVVVLTGVDDQDVAQQAVEAGAQDHLIKAELSTGHFARTLRYAVLRQRSQTGTIRVAPRANPCKVVGVLGVKGGVGTTSLACHLGLELKRQMGGRVLLADLDPTGGPMRFLLRVTPDHSIYEAANNLARLDENYWNKIFVSGVDGLEILASQRALNLEEQGSGERIRHVLRFIRSLYRCIVIDLGRFSPLTKGLLAELSDLLLTVTLDVPCLYEFKRIVTELKEAEADPKRLRLVINKTPRHPNISPAEVGEMVGLPVFAVLPEGRSELLAAYGDGGLLNEKSSLRGHIARLAARVAGLEAEKPRPTLFQSLGHALTQPF